MTLPQETVWYSQRCKGDQDLFEPIEGMVEIVKKLKHSDDEAS